jgi:hypothetical protein
MSSGAYKVITMFTRVAVVMFALSVAVCLPSSAAEFGQLEPPQATTPRSSNPTTLRGSTSQTFPSDSHPSSTMPRDTIAPLPIENPNLKVEGQIKTAVSKERRLQSDSVDVAVSDDRVMLDGEVSNHDHRYMAIRIAINYAGTRTLVDNLRLRGER